MGLTEEQEKQMKKVFSNGWEEEDIPALWRKEYFNAEMAQIEAEEREAEELEEEEEAEELEEEEEEQDRESDL
jgi:hypothetical protein